MPACNTLSATQPWQDNFPERLGAIYVAPTPFAFRALWAILSPLMNSKTRQLVSLVSTCEKLQEQIDPANLPIRMGGTDDWEFDADRDAGVLQSQLEA